jgi:F-type H+-transporting ATPase subunit alpha
VKELEEQGAMEYTIVVAATASDPAPMQFWHRTPAARWANISVTTACTRSVIYDDCPNRPLRTARCRCCCAARRAVKLIPGDVFYIHSRLARARRETGDDARRGSLTALPVIETQAGDVSAYIPTNVISITDGQIFLETGLFFKGHPSGD